MLGEITMHEVLERNVERKDYRQRLMWVGVIGCICYFSLQDAVVVDEPDQLLISCHKEGACELLIVYFLLTALLVSTSFRGGQYFFTPQVKGVATREQ